MAANKIIPADTRLAAKRGFVRTGAQSLAAVIPTSAIAITLSGEWLQGMALGAAGAVVTAVLAGLGSYLSITAKGIPGEYQGGAQVPSDVLNV